MKVMKVILDYPIVGKNKNGWTFLQEDLQKAVEEYNKRAVKVGFIGDDVYNRTIDKIAFVTSNLKLEEGNISFEISCVDTIMGKMFCTILMNDVKPKYGLHFEGIVNNDVVKDIKLLAATVSPNIGV